MRGGGAMSTTNIQPVRSARGRMEYTELGNGETREGNIANGTNRIVDEMGDLDSREDFTDYCVAVREADGRKIEGFEVRDSYAKEDLDPGNPDDVQRVKEHGYKLRKAIAPNSLCWVTVHADGKGGCLHTHCFICNNDELTGKALNHGMNHARVAAINDELSREEGLAVVGEKSATWEAKRDQCKGFERALGDAVASAKAQAQDMSAFRAALSDRGVDIHEKERVDKKTGAVSTGWTYSMDYSDGLKHRKRRRKASSLADDLTKDSLESYFAEKQAAKQAVASKAPAPPVTSAPEPITEEEPPEVSAFDAFKVDGQDVAESLDALSEAYEQDGKQNQRHYVHETAYRRIEDARRKPAKTTQQLQAEVDRARAEFRRAQKAKKEAGKGGDFLRGMSRIFGSVCGTSSDPVMRMLSSMMGAMFAELMREQQRQMREMQRQEADKRLYEARAEMWTVEKRYKAAQRAVADERSPKVPTAEERTAQVVAQGEAMNAESNRQRQDDYEK